MDYTMEDNMDYKRDRLHGLHMSRTTWTTHGEDYMDMDYT